MIKRSGDPLAKKIFDSVFDDEVHNSFLKFGRGEYKEKFLLEGKKQSSKWAIKTGPEFANALVRSCLQKAPSPVVIGPISGYSRSPPETYIPPPRMIITSRLARTSSPGTLYRLSRE